MTKSMYNHATCKVGPKTFLSEDIRIQREELNRFCGITYVIRKEQRKNRMRKLVSDREKCEMDADFCQQMPEEKN